MLPEHLNVMWNVVAFQQQMRPQREGQKKRKQTPGAADEPESKMGKTDTAGDKTANGMKPHFLFVSERVY